MFRPKYTAAERRSQNSRPYYFLCTTPHTTLVDAMPCDTLHYSPISSLAAPTDLMYLLLAFRCSFNNFTCACIYKAKINNFPSLPAFTSRLPWQLDLLTSRCCCLSLVCVEQWCVWSARSSVALPIGARSGTSCTTHVLHFK